MHEPINYKKKYKTMKKKLRFIVFEQECFLEELRKSQRRLLKVSRDRSFLLDRLLQYEKIDGQSSDSDATASSDSETDAVVIPQKKKKVPSTPVSSILSSQQIPSAASLSNMNTGTFSPAISVHISPVTAPIGSSKVAPATSVHSSLLKKGKVVKKVSKTTKVVSTPAPSTAVHMTREELERHLEMKQSTKPTFMSLEKTPNSLPDDIFMT